MFIIYCYDIFTTITKKQYKTKWLIVLFNFTIIASGVLIIWYYYHPIEPTDYILVLKRINIEFYTQIVVFISVSINICLKKENFKSNLLIYKNMQQRLIVGQEYIADKR